MRALHYLYVLMAAVGVCVCARANQAAEQSAKIDAQL